MSAIKGEGFTIFVTEIDPRVKETWSGRIFLTIDVDWASDFVMQDTIDLLVKHEVQATFLLTHKSELNASIESSRFFEVGIHPNFNFLLNGTDTKARSAHEVMENLTQHVRNPRAIRSHSVVSSSPLQQIYKEFGITHDLNSFIPHNSGIILRPFFPIMGS